MPSVECGITHEYLSNPRMQENETRGFEFKPASLGFINIALLSPNLSLSLSYLFILKS
jgi:hypothetical protein